MTGLGKLVNHVCIFSLRAGRCGVLPPYSTKEIRFSFKSGLPGSFCEDLTVFNVLDAKNSTKLTVKASIINPPSFDVQPTTLSLGSFDADELVTAETEIVVANTSYRTRRFVLAVDQASLSMFTRCHVHVYWETSGPQHVILSKETTEEIEKQEQRLKIAVRKENKEKEAKIKKLLKKLRSRTAEPSAQSDADSMSEDDGTVPVQGHWNKYTVSIFGRREQAVRVIVYAMTKDATPPPSDPATSVGAVATTAPPALPIESGTFQIRLHEVGNKEVG